MDFCLQGCHNKITGYAPKQSRRLLNCTDSVPEYNFTAARNRWAAAGGAGKKFKNQQAENNFLISIRDLVQLVR
jgi:hypothetical protein